MTTAEQAASERRRDGHADDPFRTAFECAAIGMAIVSADRRKLLDVNDAYCRTLRRSRDELAAMIPDELTHPDDRERSESFIAQLSAGEADRCQFERRYACY